MRRSAGLFLPPRVRAVDVAALGRVSMAELLSSRVPRRRRSEEHRNRAWMVEVGGRGESAMAIVEKADEAG